jgi:hypothetical protein
MQPLSHGCKNLGMGASALSDNHRKGGSIPVLLGLSIESSVFPWVAEYGLSGAGWRAYEMVESSLHWFSRESSRAGSP